MRVVQQSLAPGMKHGEKPDRGAKMRRVCRDFEQRRCARAKEQVVHDLLVL
jgi:hypothetical protein